MLLLSGGFVVISWNFSCINVLFSLSEMKSNVVYAWAQAAILRSSDHSVKEIAKFFNKTFRWVNKRSKRECGVLRRQTKKRTTVCFDQLCSKINRESEIQTNNSQQGRLPRIFSSKVSSITVWGYMTRKGWKALFWAKSLFEIREADCRRLGQFFIYRWVSWISFPVPWSKKKNDIVWGSQECDLPPIQLSEWSKVQRLWCGVAWGVVGSQCYACYPQAKP